MTELLPDLPDPIADPDVEDPDAPAEPLEPSVVNPDADGVDDVVS